MSATAFFGHGPLSLLGYTRLGAALFLLLILPLFRAHAEWGTPTTIAGDLDVSNAGTLVWAYHFTFDATSSATVNGVTFEGIPYTATGVSSNLTFGNFASRWGSNNAFSGTVPAYTNLSAEYKTMLLGAVYWTGTDGVGDGSFTLNSLVIGQPYELQFWVQDPRAGLYSNTIGREDILIDGEGEQVTLEFNDGVNLAGSLGQYVLYTFTATSASQVFEVNPGPGGSGDTSQINAMQLRSVPEPSACLLIGAGLLFVLHRVPRPRRR